MNHKKQIFRFLQRGYFSFPLKDKGKKCEIVDTFTVYLKDKKIMEMSRIMD